MGRYLLAVMLAAAPAAQRPWSEVAVIDGDPVMRGLPKDGIPAIDRPVFVPAAKTSFMADDELVIGVFDGQTAKAYSTWLLNGHEIVNDKLGSVPIAVTWCPLCYTGIVYARQVQGRTLSFGVSGMLWRDNLVMYDRQTDSWWAQAAGAAIQGPLRGAALKVLPSDMMRWKAWRTRHPDTLVLTKIEAGGLNGASDVYRPYHGTGEIGVTGRTRVNRRALPAKTRVAAFRFNGRAFAVPLDDVAAAGVIVASVDGETFIVAATADGSGARPTVLIDKETGSEWSAFDGSATAGTLAGATLERVPLTLSYWFAWQAFFPDATVIRR
ncbi:MAG: DUF3179 domain-containing protein [Acidobacteria bacterium]|nr:DUF3179 domain-containing protein [Acidobacteriota bacterium]